MSVEVRACAYVPVEAYAYGNSPEVVVVVVGLALEIAASTADRKESCSKLGTNPGVPEKSPPRDCPPTKI